MKSEFSFNATVQAAKLSTVETEEDELAYAIGWEKADGNVSQQLTLIFYNNSYVIIEII